MIDTAAVLQDVSAERARQDSKWGGRPGVDRLDANYLAILGEEFGEVCRATLENKHDGPMDLRKELVHVAAVAVAWIEQLENHP